MAHQIEFDYKELSSSGFRIAMEIADYAYPQTPEGCKKRLDYLLATDQITAASHKEIAENVTFEMVANE